MKRLAAALSLAVVILGLTFSVRAAGGADPYGYLSQADLWRHGNPKVAQPWMADVPWPQRRWAFTPIGYRPSDAPGEWAIVPTYPAGFPMLMAGAEWIAGACAAFWVVPVCGGILILATYGIGRRLVSPAGGLAAAWLVATSPPFLFMQMSMMNDVPVAAAWAVAIYCVLRAPTAGAAAASGLAAAVAILIRPNLVHLAVVMGVFVLWRRAVGGGRQRRRQAMAFAAAVAPGILVTALVNKTLFGSPTASGYGPVSALFGWSYVPINLTRYFTWLVGAQTPLVLVGVLALVVPLKPVWPDVPDRRVFVLIAALFLGVIAPYAAYFNVDDVWWMLRYLLPLWPLMMVGLSAVAIVVSRTSRPAVGAVVSAAVIVLGVNGVRLAANRSVFDLWKEARRFVAVSKLVQGITEPSSVIFSREHAGSLRYYAGRMTLRFDAFDDDWLDRGVAWLAERGVHAYVVLDEWELEHFRRQFATQSLVTQLDYQPMLVYQGTSRVFLYDLSARRDPTRVSDLINESFTGPTCVPPAPQPRLALSQK